MFERGTVLFIAASILILGVIGGVVFYGSTHPVANAGWHRVVDLRLVAKAAVLSGAPQGATCARASTEDGLTHYECSGEVCEVTLDVAKRDGGVADFYYCYPGDPGCTATGYCPVQPREFCVAGHGRTLAINFERTNVLPGNVYGGSGVQAEYSCPYDYEQSGQ